MGFAGGTWCTRSPTREAPTVWGWAPRLPQGVLELAIIRCTRKKSLKEEREMLLLSVKIGCFLCVLH